MASTQVHATCHSGGKSALPFILVLAQCVFKLCWLFLSLNILTQMGLKLLTENSLDQLNATKLAF